MSIQFVTQQSDVAKQGVVCPPACPPPRLLVSNGALNVTMSQSPAPPAIGNWGDTQVETSATGTEWVAFPSQAANELAVINGTAVDISIRRAGSTGDGTRVPSGTSVVIPLVANTNEVEVQRFDEDNTQVTVGGVWASY